MRCAFVVQLGSESQPAETQFEGWVEEVDSGRQLRFRSTEELLEFLSWRLEAASHAQGPQEKDEPCGKE